MEIRLNAILHEKISKTTKQPYMALDVNLTPSYVRTFFIEDSDVEIVKQYLKIKELEEKVDKSNN